jgi:hypothetical protein
MVVRAVKPYFVKPALRRCVLLAALTCVLQPAFAQDEPSRYELQTGVDVSYVDASGYESWTEGGAGKLRYDKNTDGLVLSRAFVDYKLRLADTLNLKVIAEIYDDDLGSNIDATEAYLEWRPATATVNRYRLKVGAFYPRMSLENTGPGWSSPYSISPSAINTWVGEELRSVGAEASVSRRPLSLGGAHTFSLYASVFYANDPAGALVSWKGWSVHDRQTRFGDELPLPPVPQIQPGMWFDYQDPFITPLLEIDDRHGYSIHGEWVVSNRFMLSAMHYDNRADPMGKRDGQFAWRTDFDHIGLRATLPGDVGLMAQWIDGATVWGRVVGSARAIDVEFRSSYLLLTKAHLGHRLTARYDRFEATENDRFPLDDNTENGHSWTIAYQYEYSGFLTLSAEWIEIFTHRAAFAYYGLEESNTESQVQLSARLRYGRK